MPKISQLPPVEAITTGSIIPVVENGITQKLSVGKLFEFLSGALDETFATETELMITASGGSFNTSSLVTTSSFNAYTASVVSINTSSLATTASLNSYTSSNDGKWNTLGGQTGSFVTEAETGSFVTNVSMFLSKSAFDTYTGSAANAVSSAINAATSSLSSSNAALDNIQLFTSSFNSFSSSINTTTASLNTFSASVNGKTGSYATTGSNEFNGNQSVTGSLNVSGGLDIKNNGYSWSFDSNGKTRIPNITFNSDRGTGMVGIKSVAGREFQIETSTAESSVGPWSFGLDGTLNAPSGANITRVANLITTSSFNTFTSSLSGVVSSSIQITNYGFATTSSLAVVTPFLSSSAFNTFATSSNTFSASVNTTTESLNNFTASVIATGSIINTFTSSVNSFSASVNGKTGSYATTGSNQFNGNQTITGSLIHGLYNTAAGENSHAEGDSTQAIGNFSHAEGLGTIAYGGRSHAEGQDTIASGSYSHAEGYQTIALADHQHVQGQFNATSSVLAAFIVGNGTDDSNRSNLIHAAGNTVEITGSLNVSGSIYKDGNKQFNYGQWASLETQTGSANTAYAMKLEVPVPELSGLYVGNNGSGFPTRIYTEHTGLYNIQFSAQLHTTSNESCDFSVWFAMTGSNIANSNTDFSIEKVSGGGFQVAALNFLTPITSGSYVELYWSKTTANGQLQYKGTQSTPTRPATPSVIVTVTQVA